MAQCPPKYAPVQVCIVGVTDPWKILQDFVMAIEDFSEPGYFFTKQSLLQ